MESVIYQATDLKDRRTEVLEAGATGRALIRAVDGTALILTRLDRVERDRLIAEWSLDLHEAERGRLPRRLRWMRHLDREDRMTCLDELWTALCEEADEDGTARSFDVALTEWRTTAVALSDPDRREVLLGDVDADADDFIAAEPPR